MVWPTPQSVLEEMERHEREDRKRISERERRFGVLNDVEQARRAREQAKRRVEHEKER